MIERFIEKNGEKVVEVRSEGGKLLFKKNLTERAGRFILHLFFKSNDALSKAGFVERAFILPLENKFDKVPVNIKGAEVLSQMVNQNSGR